MMIVGGLSDIGLVRENNQDSCYVSEDSSFPLFIVADGMGGHNAGEVASNMAVSTIKNIFLLNKEKLDTEKGIICTIKESIEKANHKIYAKSLETTKYSGMGTTVTLAYIFKDVIYIGHVGDSRAYYITEKSIKQITEDHSLVNELIKNGSITIDQGKTHPQRNVITRAIGTSNDVQVDIHTLEYKNNDKLLICSDGLTNMTDEDKILKIVNEDEGIMVKCQKLVLDAKRNGGLDNITIIIIKF